MKRLLVACALLGLMISSSAIAKDGPDYVTFGAGGYDFDKNTSNRRSVDYRLEYQWGVSLLPLVSPTFGALDRFVQIHPTAGFEGNSHGAFLGEGGLNVDVPFLHYGIFTWGESVAAFDPGNDARPLGSILQFRSQLELGWQFDNKMRVTGFISHISNAHVLSDDPGAEIAGMYVHMPLSLFEHK